MFISSTFRDMQAERDWLKDRVFPRLAEDLRARRVELKPIDLRLVTDTGQVDSDEARELQVLKVCLENIQQSRPFMVVALGDRYGTVPPPERIEAAAREQGFAPVPPGLSITALEIEFGLWRKDPSLKRRTLFFFRDPLPYRDMTAAQREWYSDEYSADPKVRARADTLRALKGRLKEDPELAGHVFDYPAQWDPSGDGEVSGLGAFERLVYDHLGALLDEETREVGSLPPATWEDRERAALAEFVEHRNRIFVGRAELVTSLIGVAGSPKPTERWGACVVGDPGSGKSAVFAKLHHDLSAERSVVVLANAAGGTTRGSSVDAMLRRWIGELSKEAGAADTTPEQASPDEVEDAFYARLRQVAVGRRVVVLLDALDQFEASPRGRYLTWLKPERWPANARLIATGLRGTASERLGNLEGVEIFKLAPLTEDDANDIANGVWERYHPTLHSTVLRRVLGNRAGDAPAYGNPLWLTLAIEQLSLLDADDFAGAVRKFPDLTPPEQMRALLLDTAATMPGNIEGLYTWLLQQIEHKFGRPLTRGFAAAIALSRFGWRESDLLDLAPRLGRFLFPRETVPDPDALELASLRRAFRAHLVRRGEQGQLDFFHAQMRRATIEHCAPTNEVRQTLHGLISDYLETRPTDAPLILLERMGQLIGEGDAARAGHYYATVDASGAATLERADSTWTLVNWITAGESAASLNSNLEWVVSWLDTRGVGSDEIYRLTYNFQYGLVERMSNDVRLGVRLRLLEATRGALYRLAASDPNNADWQRDLSVSHNKIGDVLRAQGDLDGARQAYAKALETRQRLAASDPNNADWQRDLSVSHNKIGDVLRAQGDRDGARQAYAKDLEIAQRLAASDPNNADWQRDLSVSHNKIGDVLRAQGDRDGARQAYAKALEIAQRLAASDPNNADWQRDLSVSHNKIGDVLRAQGDRDGARQAYAKALEIAQRLAASDPNNADWQRDLSVSHERIGDVLRAQGDLDGARQAYAKALETRQRLAASDPNNADWQRDLSVSHNKIGDVLRAQGDRDGARQAYAKALEIAQRLAASDPNNADWQRDLSVSHNKIGDVLRAQGDLDGARQAYAKALEIAQRLAASDPNNADWQRDLSVSHNKLGDVLRAQGDLYGARQAYAKALETRQRLAASDPNDADWQRDLSVSHERIGDVLRAQGDLDGARQAYAKALEIAQRLAASDPNNADWQRDLSVSHIKIGDVLVAQGDLDGARQAYAKALEIAQRLAASDPNNADWQRDLFVSYARMAELAEVSHEGADQALWRKAYEQLLSMKRRGTLMPADEHLLPYVRQKGEAAPTLGVVEHPGRADAAPRSLRPDPSRGSRETANHYFLEGLWDAAAAEIRTLIGAGDPGEDLRLTLVACVVNARRDGNWSEAELEKRLGRLESAGLADVADEVRRQIDARREGPTRKPWWKFW